MKVELDLPRENYYLPVLLGIFPLDVDSSSEPVKEVSEKRVEEKAPEVKTAPEVKEEKKKDFDKQVVKDLFVELARAKKHAFAKEILESYGAQKVSNLIENLDYDSYVAVCERCREVLGDA